MRRPSGIHTFHIKPKTKRNMKKLLALGLVMAICAGESMNAQAAKSVSQIQKEQKELQEEIDDLDSELVGLLADIDSLETEISGKQSEIDDTKQNIADAQAQVDAQYAAMKVRIKYMYENDDQNVWTILLESGSVVDFLNRLEYANQVYSYDREVLDNYEFAQKELEELEAALETEMTDLKSSEAQLASQKSSLNSMIATKKTQMADFDTQLAKAKQLAAQQAAQQAQSQESGGSSSGGSNSAAVSGNENPGYSTGVSGSDVVAYANSFVGNPYVWGGTSLTSGADCSGFVYRVYQHFGIDYGRLTSGGYRSVGQAVSLSNIQPGDIVCYQGHVAIYAGGGKIVEAQSTNAGITNTRNVQCKSILAIRRVL